MPSVVLQNVTTCALGGAESTSLSRSNFPGDFAPFPLTSLPSSRTSPINRKTPSGQRHEHPLPFSSIADGTAHSRNSTSKGRACNNAAIPHCCNEVGAADDPVAVTDEVLQQVEHLRLDRDQLASPPQFSPIRVERMIFEDVDQLRPPTGLADKHRIMSAKSQQ
jgi:hypothetical protein